MQSEKVPVDNPVNRRRIQCWLALVLTTIALVGVSLLPAESMGTAEASTPGTVLKVEPWSNVVFGYGYPPETNVTVSINSSVVGTATANAYGEYFIGFDARVIDIVPGNTVSVAAGVNTKSLVVSGLTSDGWNVADDTVFGTAIPGSDVEVEHPVEGGAATWRHVVADVATGDWLVDFSVPGDEVGEEVTSDIVLLGGYFGGRHVQGGEARQCDFDGDCTVRFWHERAGIGAQMTDGIVWIIESPLGADWHLTIDDPETPEPVDYSASAIAEGSEEEAPSATFQVERALLERGNVLTATDGVVTRTLVLSDFSFSTVDPSAETVAGIADPFREIGVWTDGSAYRFVEADSAGDWVADFSTTGSGPGEGSHDIATGAIGWAFDADLNGDWTERTWELLEIFSVTGPLEPVSVGTEVFMSVDYSAPASGPWDISATWSWGDNAPASGYPHAYTEPGVYEVAIEVVDYEGLSASGSYRYVVVYDPDSGFVTGGGWIDSPQGAYTADPAMTGHANLAFVSRYKKGANIPAGNTEFLFQVADLNFHSTEYDWLVVTGSDYARFKGRGSINGEGGYQFQIWARDDPDTFRIKIWRESGGGSEAILYDNGAHQELAGGSVIVHKAKNQR